MFGAPRRSHAVDTLAPSVKELEASDRRASRGPKRRRVEKAGQRKHGTICWLPRHVRLGAQRPHGV
jgi:hypothetical protein